MINPHITCIRAPWDADINPRERVVAMINLHQDLRTRRLQILVIMHSALVVVVLFHLYAAMAYGRIWIGIYSIGALVYLFTIAKPWLRGDAYDQNREALLLPIVGAEALHYLFLLNIPDYLEFYWTSWFPTVCTTVFAVIVWRLVR
jgi:hypothetical protein